MVASSRHMHTYHAHMSYTRSAVVVERSHKVITFYTTLFVIVSCFNRDFIIIIMANNQQQ